MRGLVRPGEDPPSQEQIDAVNAQFRANNDPLALAALLRADWRWAVDVPEELRSNRVPTLAVIGEEDDNKKDVDAVSEDMANLKVIVVPGTGHRELMGSPAFLEETLKFLAEAR